jgi:hypothetical protein
VISSVIVTKNLASWTGYNWFELTIVVYYLCLWRVRRCWTSRDDVFGRTVSWNDQLCRVLSADGVEGRRLSRRNDSDRTRFTLVESAVVCRVWAYDES